jgi:hypothetical protein
MQPAYVSLWLRSRGVRDQISSPTGRTTNKEECALRVILYCETPSAAPAAWILGWKRCLRCSFSR